VFTFDGAFCLLESPPYPGAVPTPETWRASRGAGILGPSAVGTLKHGISVRDRMQRKGKRIMTEASGGGGRTELERTVLQRSLEYDSFRQRLLFNWDKPRKGVPKALERGRRYSDRPLLAAEVARSRGLGLFSKQFRKAFSPRFGEAAIPRIACDAARELLAGLGDAGG
jgi:hypothetical protein